VDAPRYSPLNKRNECGFIHLSIAKRSDQRRHDALEMRLDHKMQIAVRMAARCCGPGRAGQYGLAPGVRNPHGW
jgi:hypothetical protein